MTPSTSSPHDAWHRLRSEAVLAVKDLLSRLESDNSSQDIFDVYLYAKRVLADAMEVRLKIDLDQPCDTFRDLRSQLRGIMEERYGGRVPDPYLTVPYGSALHEKLFLILLQRQGTEVPAALLRIVSGDSVHTERRVRELRELGLDIRTRKAAGADTYLLGSLDLDVSFIPKIIANTARGKKHRFMAEAELKEILGAG
ncbi:hypothetical protein [Actinomadura kijaniata]|uniref:hypothetical protein n=1 Tax=Actinomadura kijaniata TaxID=46161 RepID=UPI00082D5FCB|nr:hypothetical protein [Actinomadura kijaniata]